MKRYAISTLVLLFALTVGACAPSFKREAESLRAGFRVYASAVEPRRDFDADGDGEPDDPAVTRRDVEALEAQIDRLLDELVKAAE